MADGASEVVQADGGLPGLLVSECSSLTSPMPLLSCIDYECVEWVMHGITPSKVCVEWVVHGITPSKVCV
jgi:hypothetical protein